MAKSPRPESKEDAPRRGHARACGDLVGDIAGISFKRFGFVQGAVVSRWRGDRRRALRQGFDSRNRSASRQGKKAGGTLTLTVEGAHAPLMQHLGPLIIERVNRFFGYEAVDRSSSSARAGSLKAEACAEAAGRCGRSPRNWAKAFARSPIPNFAPASNRLPSKLAGSRGAPAVDNISTTSIPIIRSK